MRHCLGQGDHTARGTIPAGGQGGGQGGTKTSSAPLGIMLTSPLVTACNARDQAESTWPLFS